MSFAMRAASGAKLGFLLQPYPGADALPELDDDHARAMGVLIADAPECGLGPLPPA